MVIVFSPKSRVRFTLNGKRTVLGSLWFALEDNIYVYFSVPKVFRGELVLPLSREQSSGLVDFFSDAGIRFWRIVISEPKVPFDNMLCILSFERPREGGYAVHLSTNDSVCCRHLEGSPDELLFSWLLQNFKRDLLA